MLSESVLSVRKELFPQNKTAVSDMPKVNIQKKVQPTDADMVQTSLSFENIYYSLWEIAGRYSSFCQFRVIGNSHDERMIPMHLKFLKKIKKKYVKNIILDNILQGSRANLVLLLIC